MCYCCSLFMRLLTHVACVRPNFCAIAPTLATRHQSLTCTLARSCQSSYVDMKVARSAGMRFTPLMMEEDETYVNDIAVEATCMVLAGVGAGGSKQYAARLRLCSSSLVLEPETMDLPMVRFAFKAVSNLTVDSSSMITFRVSSHTILRNVGEYSSAVSINRQEAYTLSPQYSAHQSFAAQLQKIWDISQRPGSSALDNSVLISRIMHDHSKSLPFDAAWLVDGLQEEVAGEFGVRHVSPMVIIPSRISITSARIYLQPLVNLSSAPVFKFRIGSIARTLNRRHMHEESALEIFFEPSVDARIFSSQVVLGVSGCSSRHSMLLIFDNKEERTRACRILSKHSNKPVPDPIASAAAAQAAWLSGSSSNFSYILELNMLAGRSFNDLTQYPVFPWVISQYTEPTLDLLNKRTFRDLSCPIGALNAERLGMFQARLKDIPPGEPRFLYGTHYSSPGYVIYFLVREVPDLMLKLQSGKFDAPDRLFQSMSRTWNGVVTSAGDVKELIPEFYLDESQATGQGGGSFLMNRMGLKLGSRQDGQKVDNVVLPPWASSSKAYIQLNRQALECPYVSSQLHCWIDLIFGAKQRGSAAEAANNLFHPLTYSHEIGIKTVSGVHDRRAVEIQIGEFGQCPEQLFVEPHRARSVDPAELQAMHDSPLAVAPEPEVDVPIETVDASSFFCHENAATDAAAIDSSGATAVAKPARDPALLSGRAPLPPTEHMLKPRHDSSPANTSAASTGRVSPSLGYDVGSWCSLSSLVAAPRPWSHAMKKPVPLVAAASGNAICVCDDGSVSVVPFEALASGTVEHQAQASKQMHTPFSNHDDIVSHAAMMCSSSSRQLMLTSTASTMHLLSIGGDSTEIIGRHSTNGAITCLCVPSAGLGARLHQHVFIGSSSDNAGMIEMIDIDASTVRPILSLNRGLVAQPLMGSAVGVSALASLPSNPFLLAAGLTDGSVSVYDVRAGAGVGGNAMQLRVACERIGAAAFVNVGGGSDAVIAASDDGCVTMFDTRRPDLPLSIVEVHDSVTCLASDGWSLLAGDSQGRLHVIEVAGRCAGTCIDILKSHSQAILSINVCSDGVLTSSRDGLVRAWLPN